MTRVMPVESRKSPNSQSVQVTSRVLVLATGVQEEKMEWGVFGLRPVS